MVESQFPDAAATSMLQFIGVDAVDQTKQNPQLPDGVSLDASEFHNLTQIPFQPRELVKSELAYASPLQTWFDSTRKIPSGALTEGLKQDRMIGRLAYYRDIGLRPKISSALQQTAALRASNVEAGAAGAGQAGAMAGKVYVVASMCGGTGSPGVLETLYQVWEASKAQRGVDPQIMLFLYMPGFFESKVAEKSANPVAEISHLRANAYGFLRELDHFIDHSSELGQYLARPRSLTSVEIPDGDLVKQVYLVDNQLWSGQSLHNIEDAYDTTAAVLYQFLMTEVGQQQDVNGTNTDDLLLRTDRFGKRRIYCGLGLSSVTYPGDTLRNYLTRRFGDWVLRQRIVYDYPEISEQVRRDDETSGLYQALQGLHSEAINFEPADYVKAYQARVDNAPEVLTEDYSRESVSAVVANITQNSARAVNELQQQLVSRRHAVLAKVDHTVVDKIMGLGRSLPYLMSMIRRVIALIEDDKRDVERQRGQSQDETSRSQGEINRASETLEARDGLWNAISGRRKRAATELGEVLEAYGKAVISGAKQSASITFYSEVLDDLYELAHQLERATAALHEESAVFAHHWQWDKLIGKDVGPRDLTTLIPRDVHPEVEDSQLAKDSFNAMARDLEAIDTQELTRAIYREWRRAGSTRAAFDLGANNESAQLKSRDALLRALAIMSDRHALQVDIPDSDVEGNSNDNRLYLPRTLADATQRIDQGESLTLALKSLGALVQDPMLPVDQNKLPIDSPLSPSAVVAHPKRLSAAHRSQLPVTTGVQLLEWPDEERIQGVTTVWGISAHSLVAVSNWRHDYMRELEFDTEGHRRCPHVQRDFQDTLQPLEPVYEDLDMAAASAVRAMIGAELLRDVSIVGKLFGPNVQGDEVGYPLQLTDDGVWVGETCYRKKDFWAQHPTPKLFGNTIEQLLDAVVRDAPYRQLSGDFVPKVLAEATLEQTLSATEKIVNRFEAYVADSAGAPRERAAARRLHKAAVDERDQLAMKAAQQRQFGVVQ